MLKTCPVSPLFHHVRSDLHLHRMSFPLIYFLQAQQRHLNPRLPIPLPQCRIPQNSRLLQRRIPPPHLLLLLPKSRLPQHLCLSLLPEAPLLPLSGQLLLSEALPPQQPRQLLRGVLPPRHLRLSLLPEALPPQKPRQLLLPEALLPQKPRKTLLPEALLQKPCQTLLPEALLPQEPRKTLLPEALLQEAPLPLSQQRLPLIYRQHLLPHLLPPLPQHLLLSKSRLLPYLHQSLLPVSRFLLSQRRIPLPHLLYSPSAAFF